MSRKDMLGVALVTINLWKLKLNLEKNNKIIIDLLSLRLEESPIKNLQIQILTERCFDWGWFSWVDCIVVGIPPSDLILKNTLFSLLFQFHFNYVFDPSYGSIMPNKRVMESLLHLHSFFQAASKSLEQNFKAEQFLWNKGKIYLRMNDTIVGNALT